MPTQEMLAYFDVCHGKPSCEESDRVLDAESEARSRLGSTTYK